MKNIIFISTDCFNSGLGISSQYIDSRYTPAGNSTYYSIRNEIFSNPIFSGLNANQQSNLITSFMDTGMASVNGQTYYMKSYNDFDNAISKGESLFSTENPNSVSSSGWDNAQSVMSDIKGGFEALGNISKMTLDWMEYAEKKKMNKAKKELINEQIEASQELRKQRREELERIKKVRGNTQRAFNSGTTISKTIM